MTQMSEPEEAVEDKEPQKIKFHYVKSNFFRVIHADGFFGGLTPQGKINIGVFNERRPFPDLVIQEVDLATGKLGSETLRTGRDGVLRELEANIVMDIDIAQVILEWLQRHINEARALQEKVGESQPEAEPDEQL